MLAALGHNLALRVGRFELELDEESREVRGNFGTGSLTVAGSMGAAGLDTRAPKASDRSQIASNIRRHVLKPMRIPRATFVGRCARLDANRVRIAGRFTLNGVERPLDVIALRHGDRFVLEVVVRQSAFGITPFTAFGGGMRVQDPVRVSLALPASAFDGVRDDAALGRASRVLRPGDGQMRSS